MVVDKKEGSVSLSVCVCVFFDYNNGGDSLCFFYFVLCVLCGGVLLGAGYLFLCVRDCGCLIFYFGCVCVLSNPLFQV